MKHYAALIIASVAALWGCSPVKHVPRGEMLLDRVDIVISDPEANIKTDEFTNFLRQTPNHRVLGFARLPLATYSLSGSDTSRWVNRWLRRVGQAPVIFDAQLTEASRRQLRQALINKGYMDARVTVDTVLRPDLKKARVTYSIDPGKPHRITSLSFNVNDSAMLAMLRSDASLLGIKPGDFFDRNRLDEVRTSIATHMHDAGFYDFSREFISFTADTVRGSKDIALTLNLKRRSTDGQRRPVSRRHFINSVVFVTEEGRSCPRPDTVHYRNIAVVYGADRYIRPSALYDMCFIEPGQPYSAKNVDKTYSALSRLPILRFINIDMVPAGTVDGNPALNAVISISRNSKQAVSLELEGTNSDGDLGCGVAVTYQNRDLSRRSELLTFKLRTSYENLSGNMDGFINKRFTEYAAETGLTFPKFELPFASRAFKKRMQATTDFNVSFNYQERPEYTRVIVGAGWRWRWNNRLPRNIQRRHTIDLVDVNYVRLPKSTIDFINQVAPDNPLLRYAYEDHFIMRTGYSFVQSNRRIPTAEVNAFAMQPSITTWRGSIETAGNVLYGLSSLIDGPRRADEAYKLFGIQFAQYVRGELDYTYTLNINPRNAVAFHLGGGIAYPYGNSRMVPFEKRFYAGGANGVRGWSARTLGPGSYDSRNNVLDFINQCGDISLIASAEYRAKLFWLIESALFVDAGNIWTINSYPNQQGGFFRFDEFYKQIAAAYGIGLRLDLTMVLLRLDLGLKGYNPAQNQDRWPLLHPSLKRDANIHFSVGYPF